MSDKRRVSDSLDRFHLSGSGLLGTIALVMVAVLAAVFVPKGSSTDPVQSFARANEIPHTLVDLARANHLYLEEDSDQRPQLSYRARE